MSILKANKFQTLNGQTLGTVLQTVTANSVNSRVTISTSTPTDVVNVTITPYFATSKILVIVNIAGLGRPVSNNNGYGGARIVRNSTQILEMESQAMYQSDNTSNEISVGGTGGHVLDSPNTTSAVVYRAQLWANSGNAVWTDRQSSITVMEIAQ
jgi:hypothetical protein